MMANNEITITRISKASWFKINWNGKVIHFDPGYTGYYKSQGLPENELVEKADIIFVSHFHKDHFQEEALDKIADEHTVIFAPQCCVSKTKHRVTVVKESDKHSVGDIKASVIGAYNTSEGHSTRKVHHKGDFVGYVVTLGNMVLYHSGDTDVIPEMSVLGNVDIAFLPMGGTFVMDILEAVQAVSIIKPRIVIPMHQAKNDLHVFEKAVKDATKANVIVLNIGEKAIV